MKIPVWFKDKKGKYHLVPQGAIKTFEDGKVGFHGWVLYNYQTTEVIHFVHDIIDTGDLHYDRKTDRFIFTGLK